MSTNQRFVLNEKRYVVDTFNPANSAKGYCHEGDAEDDRHLRERVLMIRLSDILEKLIINLRPMQKFPSGEEHQPFNEEVHAIWLAVFRAIRASHLSSYDPTLSIQHKFGGILTRQKEGMADFTSLSLFRDDVECLLRDLYGDIDGEALDSVLYAVFSIVKAFTKYVRADLWKEHSDAENLDYMFGSGRVCGRRLAGSRGRIGLGAHGIDGPAFRARPSVVRHIRQRRHLGRLQRDIQAICFATRGRDVERALHNFMRS
jgi:hypothetical protein